MFQLLIVDDEAESMEWLKDIFSREIPEEVCVYTALSGKQAIEILNSVKCDVVLTDIKMPGMTGLELYSHIKENWPFAKVVFLTGYSSHEILYQIAQDKEVRYLVKTESPQKIMDTVLEAYHELKEQQGRILSENRKEALLGKAKYWLQKELVERLLSGMPQDGRIEEQLENLEFPCRYPYPVIVFLGRAGTEQGTLSFEQQEAVLFALQENRPCIMRMAAYVRETNYILGIVQARMVQGSVDFPRIFHVCAGMLENVQEICQQKLKVKITFALCKEETLWEDFGKTYCLLKERLIMTMGNEVPSVLKVGLQDMDKNKISNKRGLILVPVLENYLEEGNFGECKAVLQEIGLSLQGSHSMHDMGALELYYNVSMVYLKYINAKEWGEKLPFHTAVYPLTRVDDFSEWGEAMEYLQQLTDTFARLVRETDDHSRNLAIKRVEQYIHKHLKEDLGLQVLAEVGGFNASYLSRIFKQEYHCNLSEYIMRTRLGYARKLLAETDEKIYHIAEESGYQTVSSFNRVFKKAEGMSPAEYRLRYQSRR